MSSMPSDNVPEDKLLSDNAMPPVKAPNDQRPAAPDWKSGILALSVIAFTVLIAAYGLLAVEPGIPAHYAKICKDNFLKLGFSTTNTPSVDEYLAILQTREDRSNDSAVDENAKEAWSASTDQSLLEQIHLCLRRLQVLNPSNDQFRYQAAIVSEMLSELFLHSAHQAPRGSERDIDELLARSAAERDKAKELMISIQSKQSENASSAALWLVSNQFNQAIELSSDALNIADEMLAKATSAPDNQDQTTRLRAKINYLRSVNLDTSRSAKDRQELAVAASRMLDASRITSTLDRAWIAEMKFMVDTKQAKSLAWESVQNYWSKGERDYQRPEELAAMLQCLLRSSNLKESQVFLSKRLPKLSTKDQSLLRKYSAMACVRAAVANSIQTSFQTEFESIPSAQLIDLAIQLDPESNELSRLVLQIASANRENEFLRILVPELHADTTNPIGKLIDSISPEEQTTSETRLQYFSSFASTSSSHAIFAMRIVDTLLREKKLERAVAIDYLRTITDHFPSVLSAWSIRASLHSDQQELDQAIQCYEKMSEQLPANVDIKNAIQELRARQRENATPPS